MRTRGSYPGYSGEKSRRLRYLLYAIHTAEYSVAIAVWSDCVQPQLPEATFSDRLKLSGLRPVSSERFP